MYDSYKQIAEKLERIQNYIACYDDLIKMNNDAGVQATKDNDMCKASFHFGKVSAYQEAVANLKELLKI